jgi:hypothetical protein
MFTESKDQVDYVDLNEVVSRVRRNRKQSNKNLKLKDFVKKIRPALLLPGVIWSFLDSGFEKSYWYAFCIVKKKGESVTAFVYKPRATIYDGLPAAILETPALYNNKQHVLEGNMLYLSLRAKTWSSKIFLAIYRLDRSAKKFIEVCFQKFELPEQVVESNPRIPSYDVRIKHESGDSDALIAIKGRVFSLFRPHEFKNLLWIHCFMKKRILPIGGGNQMLKGLYSLNPMITLQYEYHDAKVVGIFGVNVIHLRRGNDRVYKTMRYVLV